MCFNLLLLANTKKQENGILSVPHVEQGLKFLQEKEFSKLEMLHCVVVLCRYITDAKRTGNVVFTGFTAP